MHDVVIIGGGPAGLSAALNGAAEGLNTLLLEKSPDLGGQAGTSSRIENYLGFPNGVAGQPLTKKAVAQAKRLGAAIKVDHAVMDVTHNPATGYWVTTCRRGTEHVSRAVIVASGMDYRRLPEKVDPEHRAIYGAPASAHDECKGHNVVVIGGGNSAGQAALNLAKIGANVTLLVRRALKQTMSTYLIERIAVNRSITAMIGNAEMLSGSELLTEEGLTLPAWRTFAYLGGVPRTDFVHRCCTIKDPGFIKTDDELIANPDGLFVAGDVRVGSFHRVAAAVGEGAIAAAAAWRYVYNA